MAGTEIEALIREREFLKAYNLCLDNIENQNSTPYIDSVLPDLYKILQDEKENQKQFSESRFARFLHSVIKFPLDLSINIAYNALRLIPLLVLAAIARLIGLGQGYIIILVVFGIIILFAIFSDNDKKKRINKLENASKKFPAVNKTEPDSQITAEKQIPFLNFFKIIGRISVKEYVVSFIIGLSLISYAVYVFICHNNPTTNVIIFAASLFVLGVHIVLIQAAKRVQDLGKPFKFAFIPRYWVKMLHESGEKQPNIYGFPTEGFSGKTKFIIKSLDFSAKTIEDWISLAFFAILVIAAGATARKYISYHNVPENTGYELLQKSIKSAELLANDKTVSLDNLNNCIINIKDDCDKVARKEKDTAIYRTIDSIIGSIYIKYCHSRLFDDNFEFESAEYDIRKITKKLSDIKFYAANGRVTRPFADTAKKILNKLHDIEQSLKDQKYDERNMTFKIKDVEFTMIYVEGGNLKMHTEYDSSTRMGSEHVTHDGNFKIKDFFIGQTEVTNALYNVVVYGKKNPVKRNEFVYDDGEKDIDTDELPVSDLDIKSMKMFIDKLNKLTGKKFRLPRESEWEYAARGGKKSKGYEYSGSNTGDKVAWRKKDTKHPVKLKKSNELGIFDMSGNVSEVCYDDFAVEKSAYVTRGGSYYWYKSLGYDIVEKCYISDRKRRVSETFKHGSMGIRLVLCK
jgi:formylglycine-generating enzyme required for sulfatase activity